MAIQFNRSPAHTGRYQLILSQAVGSVPAGTVLGHDVISVTHSGKSMTVEFVYSPSAGETPVSLSTLFANHDQSLSLYISGHRTMTVQPVSLLETNTSSAGVGLLMSESAAGKEVGSGSSNISSGRYKLTFFVLRNGAHGDVLDNTLRSSTLTIQNGRLYPPMVIPPVK